MNYFLTDEAQLILKYPQKRSPSALNYQIMNTLIKFTFSLEPLLQLNNINCPGLPTLSRSCNDTVTIECWVTYDGLKSKITFAVHDHFVQDVKYLSFLSGKQWKK